jgi:hypothetical protein
MSPAWVFLEVETTITDPGLAVYAGRRRRIQLYSSRGFLPKEGARLDTLGRVGRISPFFPHPHEMKRTQSNAGLSSVIANQRKILANQKTITTNQKKLDAILKNQMAIQKNQRSILANQDRILANQSTIMAAR